VRDMANIYYNGAWMAETSEPYTVTHIGRNDPCICGSGKKFNACCRRAR